MTSDNSSSVGPLPDHYAGRTPARRVKRLFNATRPAFFPASVLPVIAGTAWGFAAGLHFDPGVFMLALLATVCVHAGANVLNDVGDDAGGTDRCNERRIYPYTGGSRFIQTGIMSAASMARLGISLLGIAAIAGLVLLLAKGVPVLWFGVAGVFLAVLYSLGPLRLSAAGLGEMAVAIGFGVLPVTGAAWLQSTAAIPGALSFSLPISAWVAAILLINEVPDIEADGATGKRTLPVRCGLRGTAALYLGLHGFAALSVLALCASGKLPWPALAVPMILLLPARRAAAAIRRGADDPAGMRRAIEVTLGVHTIGTLSLTAAVLFMAFTAG